MMFCKKIALFIAGSYLSLMCFAQKKYTVQFDATGKIIGSLPDRLDTKNQLVFKLNDPDESIENYTGKLVKKLENASKNIDALLADKAKLKVLEEIYGIKKSDLEKVKAELEVIRLKKGLEPESNYAPAVAAKNAAYYQLKPINTVATGPIQFTAGVASPPLDCALNENQTELDFILTKTDPFQQLIFNWLEKSKASFKQTVNKPVWTEEKIKLQALIKEVKEFVANTKPVIDTMKEMTKQSSFFLATAGDKADDLAKRVAALIAIIRPTIDLTKNKEWMLKWIWYYDEKGLPPLNPFPFLRPDEIGAAPDTSELASLQIKIGFRENVIRTADLKTFRVGQLDSMINYTDSLKRRITSIQKSSVVYKSITDKNDNAVKAFGATDKQLYKGILFANSGESKDPVGYMRHHDASASFQLMNPLTKDAYLETDRVIILDHNLQVGEQATFHISFAAITEDQSLLADLLRPVLKQLIDAASKIGTVAAQKNAAADTSLKSMVAGQLNGLEAQLERAALPMAENLDYLALQSNPMLTIKRSTDQTKSWHSQTANPPKKIDGPQKASYYQNIKDGSAKTADGSTVPAISAPVNPVVADTFSYRINKLYRIFPMAGFAYTITTFSNITEDPTTHISSIKTDHHVRFIVGAKVYIHKTDIRSPYFFTQDDNNGKCLFLSRLSITAAIEPSHPLNNIYTGIGLDLWPGVCVNVGAVFNKYSYNVYYNGQSIQSKNLYRTGFYAGFSTDLTLFADVLKLLNLSK